MKRHDNAGIGFQVYVDEGGEEIGAVREVHDDHLLVYVENAGDFKVGPDAIRSIHDGKVLLDAAAIAEELRDAISHAHDEEAM